MRARSIQVVEPPLTSDDSGDYLGGLDGGAVEPAGGPDSERSESDVDYLADYTTRKRAPRGTGRAKAQPKPMCPFLISHVNIFQFLRD